MSIKVTCAECKQKMVDSIMEHLPTCSANLFKPISGTYIMPPGQVISFDSPEEQAEWLRNLGASSGEHLTLRELAPSTEYQDKERV